MGQGDFKTIDIPLMMQISLDPKQLQAGTGWISSCHFEVN
jgi:hypothetical protein